MADQRDPDLRSLLANVHAGDKGKGFHSTWNAAQTRHDQPRVYSGSRLVLAGGMLAVLVACLFAVFRPHESIPVQPARLAALGDLHGPTDFLLARHEFSSPTSFLMPADPVLSLVPDFSPSTLRHPHPKGTP